MYSVLVSEWFLFSLFGFSFVMSAMLLVQFQSVVTNFIVSLRFEHLTGNFEVEFMMMSADFTFLINWVSLLIIEEGDGHWFVSGFP